MLNRQVAWVSDSADHGNDEEMIWRYGIGVSERHDAAILVNDICRLFLSDDPCEDVLRTFCVVYAEMEQGYSPCTLVQVYRQIYTPKNIEDSSTTPRPPLPTTRNNLLSAVVFYKGYI